MLSYVFFRFRFPRISTFPVFGDLLRSFSLSRPRASLMSPSWDVIEVIKDFRSPPHELLESIEFRALSVGNHLFWLS